MHNKCERRSNSDDLLRRPTFSKYKNDVFHMKLHSIDRKSKERLQACRKTCVTSSDFMNKNCLPMAQVEISSPESKVSLFRNLNKRC